jgi:hypothetical protein
MAYHLIGRAKVRLLNYNLLIDDLLDYHNLLNNNDLVCVHLMINDGLIA